MRKFMVAFMVLVALVTVAGSAMAQHGTIDPLSVHTKK